MGFRIVFNFVILYLHSSCKMMMCHAFTQVKVVNSSSGEFQLLSHNNEVKSLVTRP